jgi:hypothetical protein
MQNNWLKRIPQDSAANLHLKLELSKSFLWNYVFDQPHETPTEKWPMQPSWKPESIKLAAIAALHEEMHSINFVDQLYSVNAVTVAMPPPWISADKSA